MPLGSLLSCPKPSSCLASQVFISWLYGLGLLLSHRALFLHNSKTSQDLIETLLDRPCPYRAVPSVQPAVHGRPYLCTINLSLLNSSKGYSTSIWTLLSHCPNLVSASHHFLKLHRTLLKIFKSLPYLCTSSILLFSSTLPLKLDFRRS